jgi:hypothetical protein
VTVESPIVARSLTVNEGPPMSRSPDEAPDEPVDLERLVIDSDYRQEVTLRLRAESLARRTRRVAGRSDKLSSARKD